MSSSAAEYFNSIPPVTKYFVILSALVPLVMKIGLIPPSLLVFHWPSISQKYEVTAMSWSILTYPAVVAPLYALFHHSSQFELHFQCLFPLSILASTGKCSFSRRNCQLLLLSSRLWTLAERKNYA